MNDEDRLFVVAFSLLLGMGLLIYYGMAFGVGLLP